MKRFNILLLFTGLVTLGIIFPSPLKAENQPDRQVTAVNQNDKILAKLEAIETRQNQIFDQLNDIKAELEIVKIRATLKT